MTYQIAERFKSLQGEGVYAGTPMAFIRFVGCSVGKKICQHCDTVFERSLPWQGGGEYTAEELLAWASPYQHICLTGGEPFDLDFSEFIDRGPMLHVESSGTKVPTWFTTEELACLSQEEKLWLCISPKPGFDERMISIADEVKVIVPGLGSDESLEALRQNSQKAPVDGKPPAHPLADRDTFRWPDVHDALRWAAVGQTVFLQPRNARTEIDKTNLMIVMDLLKDHPQLRLSTQLHKILKVQ